MTKETKVYLNKVEDLTKALSEGKTVYAMDEFCDGESKLELINNILVRKDLDDEILIDGTIYFKTKAFYLKEKEPLKIEVGKFYKLGLVE